MDIKKLYKVLFGGLAIIAILFGSFSPAQAGETVKTGTSAKSNDGLMAPPESHWQLPRHDKIKNKVNEKAKEKAPKITKDKQSGEIPLPDRSIMITGTLTVEFDNPEQGDFKKDGRAKWPDPVISEESLSSLGTKDYPPTVKTFLPGDYTHAISETVRQKIKEVTHVENIWENYVYGEEPRQYTIDEELVISNIEPITSPTFLESLNLYSKTVQDIIKFGYSIPNGPGISYHFYEKWESCFDIPGFGRQCVVISEARANIDLNWRFHLWFPFLATLNAPDIIRPSISTPMTSLITPLDEPVTKSNDPKVGEEGHEFDLLFLFNFNVYAKLAGATVVDVSLPSFNVARQEDFSPPFKPNPGFKLAEKELNPITWNWPYSSISLIPKVGLSLTSSGVDAEWKVEAGGSTLGSGPLRYTNANSLVQNTINISTPTPAKKGKIKVEFQKYYLDTLEGNVTGSFQFSVFGYVGDTQDFTLLNWKFGTIEGAYFPSDPEHKTVEVEAYAGVDNDSPVINFRDRQPGQWPAVAEIQDNASGLAEVSVNCKFNSFDAGEWPNWAELDFNVPAFAPGTTEKVLLRGVINDVATNEAQCLVWAQDIYGNRNWNVLPGWPEVVGGLSNLESKYRVFIPTTLKVFDQNTNTETAASANAAPLISFQGPEGNLWDSAQVRDADSGLTEISVNCKFGSVRAAGDWPNWAEFDVNFPAFSPGTTEPVSIRGFQNNLTFAEMQCGLWAMDKEGKSTWKAYK